MQRRVRIELLEMESHRQALDDLDPVAGGVFSRQQRKGEPRAWTETIYARVKHDIGTCIDLDRRRSPRPHTSQLGLLEIRLDPDPVGRH